MRHMRRAIAALLLASPRVCDAACPATCPDGMYDKSPDDCNDGWACGANCAGGTTDLHCRCSCQCESGYPPELADSDETPGGSILLRAHRAIESITLDREVAHLKDELMPRYAKLIYNGYWWAPERHALQAAIDQTQLVVNGEVRVALYKGNVTVTGRRSRDSLFDENIATFEADGGAYDQADAEGFIQLNALRLRIAANKGRQHH